MNRKKNSKVIKLTYLKTKFTAEENNNSNKNNYL